MVVSGVECSIPPGYTNSSNPGEHEFIFLIHPKHVTAPLKKVVFNPFHRWKASLIEIYSWVWLLCAAVQELGQHSLESKGLCLVPISYTAGIASSNGADLWAPIKSPSPKFKNSFSQFHWHSLARQIVEGCFQFQDMVVWRVTNILDAQQSFVRQMTTL